MCALCTRLLHSAKREDPTGHQHYITGKAAVGPASNEFKAEARYSSGTHEESACAH